MISLNNIDNLFQSVIMVDANGNRVVNSTMAGQNRQPQKNSYALPQKRFPAPGVPKILTCLALHIIVFPGGTSTGPAPAGWSSREVSPRVLFFEWPTGLRTLLNNINLYQECVGQETPIEQRYHYPAPNLT